MSGSTFAPVPGSAPWWRLRAKGWMAAPLFLTGLHRLLMGGRGVVVAFHRVDDRVRGSPIGCSRGEFARYLDFFARHFRVVALSDLVARLAEGRSVRGRLAVTFDDGYRDNFTVAAPMLRERGLPACFFVSTALVGSRAQPWWDAEFGARAEWMTWDQVRALHAQGFEIGAHTVTHADLAAVSGDEAEREIAGARERLERELGAPVTLFSYPYGAPHRISDENRRRVARAGFRCCLSAYGGTVAPGDDPFRLKRAPVTPWHLSPAHLGFELLFRPPSSS